MVSKARIDMVEKKIKELINLIDDEEVYEEVNPYNDSNTLMDNLMDWAEWLHYKNHYMD